MGTHTLDHGERCGRGVYVRQEFFWKTRVGLISCVVAYTQTRIFEVTQARSQVHVFNQQLVIQSVTLKVKVYSAIQICHYQ